MMVSPVITFTWLELQAKSALRTGAEGASTWEGTSKRNAAAPSGSHAAIAESRSEQPMAMLWVVAGAFLGVLLLSLRTAGALFLLDRIRRKEIKPLASELYD